jgi:hypothetical protein
VAAEVCVRLRVGLGWEHELRDGLSASKRDHDAAEPLEKATPASSAENLLAE